jgi:hypothetical protein
MFPLPLAQVAAEASGELLAQILAAFQQKNWYLLGVLVVVGLVGLIRKFVGKVKYLSFFATDRGGAILALVAGLAGALGIDALNGVVDIATMLDGLKLGLASAGGYVVVKRIVWPADASKPAALTVVDTTVQQ